ncbi:hypothetical protein [Halorussus litoreus]|uniref:hypothetical protein n=1 Tax=Halorussus litoreus TaxID=1710536 RepID=UPI0018E527F9|nr:hypothetical protein [Halorussus litoreus]
MVALPFDGNPLRLGGILLSLRPLLGVVSVVVFAGLLYYQRRNCANCSTVPILVATGETG